MDWSNVAAVCTGIGALLAGWAALRKAKIEGSAGCRDELDRCRRELREWQVRVLRGPGQ